MFDAHDHRSCPACGTHPSKLLPVVTWRSIAVRSGKIFIPRYVHIYLKQYEVVVAPSDFFMVTLSQRRYCNFSSYELKCEINAAGQFYFNILFLCLFMDSKTSLDSMDSTIVLDFTDAFVSNDLHAFHGFMISHDMNARPKSIFPQKHATIEKQIKQKVLFCWFLELWQ